jgi:hypothetical protein
LQLLLDLYWLPVDGKVATEKCSSKDSGGGPGIRGDETNILVLLFLYILQGIPLGLAAAIPLILTNRNVRYVKSDMYDQIIPYPHQ